MNNTFKKYLCVTIIGAAIAFSSAAHADRDYSDIEHEGGLMPSIPKFPPPNPVPVPLPNPIPDPDEPIVFDEEDLERYCNCMEKYDISVGGSVNCAAGFGVDKNNPPSCAPKPVKAEVDETSVFNY